MTSAPTVFHDVLVLHRTDTGWLCEIEGRPIFLAQLQIAAGTSVPSEGQRGSIRLADFAADEIREKLRLRQP